MAQSTNMDVGLQIGATLRMARTAKGWSQEELARRAGTTAQNISKYEKNGLVDYNWIKLLSAILEQDLTKESIDEEGTVGEIGKEILSILIKNEGYINKNELERLLYGMSKERVNKEIFKLERIGLVVCEDYIDWDYLSVKKVFLSAKGYITYKNMNLTDAQAEILKDNDSINTYEAVIGEHSCYQEYIDSNEAERIIRSINYGLDEPWFTRHDGLDREEYIDALKYNKQYSNGKNYLFYKNISTDYRINYIAYLKWNFENTIDYDKKMGECIPGMNCYHDILYRMAIGLTRDKVRANILDIGFDNVWDEYRDLCRDYNIYESIEEDTWIHFKNDFPSVEAKSYRKIMLERVNKVANELAEKAKMIAGEVDLDNCDDDDPMVAQVEAMMKQMEDINRLATLFSKVLENDEYKYGEFETIIKNNRPKGKLEFPIDWFTEDEIRAFIEANMGPAETEEEKELDRILKRINDLNPSTLAYYKFPKSWEENGLASLVRRNAGIE